MKKKNLLDKSVPSVGEEKLIISVRDLSDFRTFIKAFPNSKVNEEVPKKDFYKIKEMKAILKRLQTVLSMLGKYKEIT